MGRTSNTTGSQRSALAKRRALATQCPKCGRKSALIRRNLPADVTVACRYTLQGECDYVKMTTLE